MPIKLCLKNVYLGYHTYVVITVCSILIKKTIYQNDKNETDFVDFYYPRIDAKIIKKVKQSS